MAAENSVPQTTEAFNALTWLGGHPKVAVYVWGFCLYISVCLILRIWIIHRRAGFLRKMVWSLIVLIPLFGWLAYGGCFRPLETNSNPCPREHDWASGSGEGGGGFHSGFGGHHH
jgi:hypothetical protein